MIPPSATKPAAITPTPWRRRKRSWPQKKPPSPSANRPVNNSTGPRYGKGAAVSISRGSGGGGATLMGGIGTSAAPMNGYPKVFNIESDPHEEHNIAELYNWVLAPLLKAVGDYKASLAKNPNPPAANMTRF